MTIYYENGNVTTIIITETERQDIISKIDSVNLNDPKLNHPHDHDILDPTKLRHQITTVEDGGEEVDPNTDQIMKLNMALRKVGIGGVKYKFDAAKDSIADSRMIGIRCQDVRDRKKIRNNKKKATGTPSTPSLVKTNGVAPPDDKLLRIIDSRSGACVPETNLSFNEHVNIVFAMLKNAGASYIEIKIYSGDNK